MLWARSVLGGIFYLAIYFAFVRRRHVQVLHPRSWLGEARSFRPSQGFLKKFAILSGILALFYIFIPIINEFAEAVMGTPSVAPGSANPTAVLASISPLVLLFLSTTLPIFEEWFFRHVLIDSTRKRLGITGSLIFSSVLFSFAHLFNEGSNLPMFFVPFFAGLVLGAVFLKWGLKGSIFVHSSNNFLRTILWMVG